MSQTVQISELVFFHDEKRLSSLNELISINNVLNPGMISGYTNCHFDDALYILVLLFDLGIADAFTLVYDRRNMEDGAIGRRSLKHGFPRLPFKYRYLDQEFIITDPKDMLFVFEFEITVQDLEFVVDNNV